MSLFCERPKYMHILPRVICFITKQIAFIRLILRNFIKAQKNSGDSISKHAKSRTHVQSRCNLSDCDNKPICCLLFFLSLFLWSWLHAQTSYQLTVRLWTCNHCLTWVHAICKCTTREYASLSTFSDGKLSKFRFFNQCAWTNKPAEPNIPATATCDNRP